MEGKIKSRKKSGWFVRIFFLIFVLAVIVGVYWQYQKYRALQVEMADLEQQIAQEQQKMLDFEAKKDYYNSDSYIEQIAREKLGLVKSNEVLYINRGQ